MNNTHNSPKHSGFTIIEVLIVLAIAGLIMIVVFMAVPALQRNQRNAQTRTEANNVAAAYREVSINKGNKVLTGGTAGDTEDSPEVVDASRLQTIERVLIRPGPTGSNTLDVPEPSKSQPSVIVRIFTMASCTSQESSAIKAASTRQIAFGLLG